MRIALALLGGLLAACAAFRPPPLVEGTVESRIGSEGAAPTHLTLGPGDRVAVKVLLHPEISTVEAGVLLDPMGQLDLAATGPVSLNGLTVDEARTRLTAEFARFVKEPSVSVSLIELASRRVYIFGEVDRPGAYVLDRPLTALQALTLAGGFRPGADRDQVALLRGTRAELQVHYFDAATPGPEGLVGVQPDDFLFVRLSGAGTFRDQILPIVQGLVPPITGLASVILVADRLAE
jgi:polysaccharide export outer membrane protein